jgi:hypothetical protein
VSTRTDLLTAAEQAAAAAIAEDANYKVRGSETLNAKTALEAAALAQDIGPGEFAEALGLIQEQLEEAGVLAESMEMEPADFLRRTLAAVVHWRREAIVAEQVTLAYGALRGLVEGLERDFIAGDSETSRRIAARIRATLDDVDQTINNTTEQGG